MQHGIKIGIGGLVVAMGIVCGVIAFGCKQDKPEAASTTGATEASTPAPSATPPAENSGAAASPQPVSVAADADRSLRPQPTAAEGPKEPAPAATEKPAEPALPAVAPTPAPSAISPTPEPAPVTPAPAPVTPAAAPVTPAPASDMKDKDDVTELPPIETAAKAAEEPKPVPAAAKPSTPKVHVVQAGESYSSIAKKYFGNTKYASLIAKANPGKDARKLYVGAKVNLPPAPAGAVTTKPAADATAAPMPVTEPKSAKPVKNTKAAPAAEPAAPIPPDRAYKVRAGEHWTDLAQRFLGNSNRWPELYELNKERVAHNPHALKSGTTIELPAGVKVTTKPS